MPVLPDISHHPQLYLMPSTSRLNPPRGPLTPIQQLIPNSCNSENKEPKNNRSQPDHPHPHSVLRTGTRQGYKL